jgi:hypothetical protein
LETLIRSSKSNDDDDDETGRTIPSIPINDLVGGVVVAYRVDLDLGSLCASSPTLLRSLTTSAWYSGGGRDEGTGRTLPSVSARETGVVGCDEYDEDEVEDDETLALSPASSSTRTAADGPDDDDESGAGRMRRSVPTRDDASETSTLASCGRAFLSSPASL